MNKIFLFFLLLASLNLTGQPSSEKNKLIASINENKNQYEESALKIWDWAEVGYQEYKSAEELQRLLKNEGFSLEVGVANIPTAFVATYKNGEGPVVGILGEYDALPGLSQTNEPKKNLRDGVSSGHACGHNLFGVASAASSIAIKNQRKILGPFFLSSFTILYAAEIYGSWRATKYYQPPNNKTIK